METEKVRKFIDTFLKVTKEAKIEQMSAICNISEEEYEELIKETKNE